MSFFIRERDNKLYFGGMKSIEMDYDYVTPLGKLTLLIDEGRQFKVEHMWIIGSATMTSYMKAYLRSGAGQYDEDQFAKFSSINDVVIVVRIENQYYIYRNGSRIRQLIEDGVYALYHGTTLGQVDCALQGLAPTRWMVESTQV